MSSSDSKIIDDDKNNNNKDKDTNNNDNDDNNSSDSDLEEAHRLLSEQEARDRELALALSQGKRRSGRSRRAVVPTGSTAAAVTQSRDQVLLASVTNAFNGYGQGEHLRDIPHVRESLEQARDDAQWIKLLYYYTFERGELAEMPSGAVRKARLLAFNGFEDQSPERVERFRNFMAQQSSEVLETIRANLDLSVDVPKRTKAAVAAAIAEFMAEPEEPEDKPKPKARKRSRASASGAKKGKGKSKGKSKKKQKKKASKASGAGRTNAYMMFCKEQRPLMKDSHPDATFGELNKLIGAKWHSLTDEGKAEYTNRAAVENERREAGGGAAAPKTSGTKRKRATKAKSKAKAKKKVKKETTDDDGDVEMAAPSQPKAKKSKAKKPAADDSKQKRIISALINDLLSRSDLGSLSQKGVRKHIAEQLGKDVAKSYKAFIKEHTAKRVKQMIV